MKRLSKFCRVGLIVALVAAMSAEMCLCVFAGDVPVEVVPEGGVVEPAPVVVEEPAPVVPEVVPVVEPVPVESDGTGNDMGMDPATYPVTEPVADPVTDVVVEPVTDPAATVVDPSAVEPTAPVQIEPVTYQDGQQVVEPSTTEPEGTTTATAASTDTFDVEGVSNDELESYLWDRGMGEWASSIDTGDGTEASYTWGLNTLTREPAELKGYNFAIFGLSGENSGDNGRSDTIIICTIDPERKEIKLTSILRDTKAAIEGHEPQKINAAHMIGGPELAIETLNKNFGLTLKHYVTVQFETLMDIVDTVGGIDIELSQDEADFINEYSVEYGIPALTEGVQHLNGWQSVLYCRIRKIDSDKVRAGRQQTVIRKIFEKLSGAGFLQWFKIVTKMLETTKISMPLGDILEVVGLPLGEYSLVNNVVPDIEYETDLKTAIDEHGEWVWLYDLGKAGDRIVDIINNQ